MYVRVGQDSGSTIEWYWISDKTGLPRAAQRINLRRGATRLTDRAVISVVRINPRIPAGTFTYSPAPADSTPAASPAAERTPRSLRGTRLPDLEVRDASYAALKLSELAGKPFSSRSGRPGVFIASRRCRRSLNYGRPIRAS